MGPLLGGRSTYSAPLQTNTKRLLLTDQKFIFRNSSVSGTTALTPSNLEFHCNSQDSYDRIILHKIQLLYLNISPTAPASTSELTDKKSFVRTRVVSLPINKFCPKENFPTPLKQKTFIQASFYYVYVLLVLISSCSNVEISESIFFSKSYILALNARKALTHWSFLLRFTAQTLTNTSRQKLSKHHRDYLRIFIFHWLGYPSDSSRLTSALKLCAKY